MALRCSFPGRYQLLARLSGQLLLPSSVHISEATLQERAGSHGFATTSDTSADFGERLEMALWCGFHVLDVRLQDFDL